MNKDQPLNKGQVTTMQACYFKLNKPLRSGHLSIVTTKALPKGWPILRGFNVTNTIPTTVMLYTASTFMAISPYIFI